MTGSPSCRLLTAAISDGSAWFSGGLANVAKLADLKQQRLLQATDEQLQIPVQGRYASLRTPEHAVPRERDAPILARVRESDVPPEGAEIAIGVDAGAVLVFEAENGAQPER